MHLELAGIWKPAFSFWYSCEPSAVNHLLPSGFKFHCRKSRAFCNIFLSYMQFVRPTGLPVWCGIHGWQINYCLYVTSSAEASGEVKGLYVVRSFIDEKHFLRLGNLMPYFHFQRASIQMTENQLGLNFELRSDNYESSFIVDKTIAPNSFQSKALGKINEAMDFLQYRNTFVLTSGDFLEFGDLHFSQNGRRIIGPIGSLEFHKDVDQNELQLEFAARIESADFHLILGRRERPAMLPEYAEIER
jgi:hypothetical protein